MAEEMGVNKRTEKEINSKKEKKNSLAHKELEVINKQNWIRNRDLELVTIEIYINDRQRFQTKKQPIQVQ
ncbi:hypothetical protein NC653_025813 [Populus alba x Populus x berolinensis]|uniref:Uncharacterized protein n=1 Tax=Populus alba x Populus x berolinensis TaxID=444605 RepID=A0AAD6MC63_9ROSI|nr:hypothetical protein NC653_025813 [Populus alba x Populus x berolinensis]